MFKYKQFYICALVGVQIKCLYEMHGAAIKRVLNTVSEAVKYFELGQNWVRQLVCEHSCTIPDFLKTEFLYYGHSCVTPLILVDVYQNATMPFPKALLMMLAAVGNSSQAFRLACPVQGV